MSHHPPISCLRVYSPKNKVAFDQVVGFRFTLGTGGLYFVLKNNGSCHVRIGGYDEVYKVDLANIIIQPRASFLISGGADLLYTGRTRIECTKTGLVGEVSFAKKVVLKQALLNFDIAVLAFSNDGY